MLYLRSIDVITYIRQISSVALIWRFVSLPGDLTAEGDAFLFTGDFLAMVETTVLLLLVFLGDEIVFCLDFLLAGRGEELGGEAGPGVRQGGGVAQYGTGS